MTAWDWVDPVEFAFSVEVFPRRGAHPQEAGADVADVTDTYTHLTTLPGPTTADLEAIEAEGRAGLAPEDLAYLEALEGEFEDLEDLEDLLP